MILFYIFLGMILIPVCKYIFRCIYISYISVAMIAGRVGQCLILIILLLLSVIAYPLIR